MAELMTTIDAYETEEDSERGEDMLNTIIDEVMLVERCSFEVAQEFAYMIKLAKANDAKLPGEYVLKRLFSYIKLAMNMGGR